LSASGTAAKKHDVHVGRIAEQLLPMHGGRGGGKGSFAQGSVATGTRAERLFADAAELLSRKKG